MVSVGCGCEAGARDVPGVSGPPLVDRCDTFKLLTTRPALIQGSRRNVRMNIITSYFVERFFVKISVVKH